MKRFEEILNAAAFTHGDLVRLLKAEGEEIALLFEKSTAVKAQHIGKRVWFRGLVEFSNICEKDCLYCGIRHSNSHVKRYNLSDTQILEAARFAWENRYGSLVLQSGEIMHPAFADRIEHLLCEMKKLSLFGIIKIDWLSGWHRGNDWAPVSDIRRFGQRFAFLQGV